MRSKCFLLATRENGSNQVENLSEQSRDSNKPNLYMVPRPESNPGHIGSRQVVSSRQQHCVNLKQHKSQDTAQVAGCVCGGGRGGVTSVAKCTTPFNLPHPGCRGLLPASWLNLRWSCLIFLGCLNPVNLCRFQLLSFPILSYPFTLTNW